jgi:hypothetical protein
MTPEELAGKVVIGEFVDIVKPVLNEELDRVRRELREGDDCAN